MKNNVHGMSAAILLDSDGFSVGEMRLFSSAPKHHQITCLLNSGDSSGGRGDGQSYVMLGSPHYFYDENFKCGSGFKNCSEHSLCLPSRFNINSKVDLIQLSDLLYALTDRINPHFF